MKGACLMERLPGKKAIVTGAARGLGEAVSERLAREGCDVALLDIQAEQVARTADRIASQTGRECFGLACDVTDEASVEEAFARALERFGGRLDILVANAGILFAEDITEFPVDRWRKVIDVNLVGYMICAKHACRVMAKQKSGVIIQINSKSGKRGSFRNSAYAASKFGGIGLTQSIALDMAPYGVRVNCVCPGNLLDSPLWVESLYAQYAKKWGMTEEEVRRKYEQQVPLGRGCTYDDVTNAVVFLASDESSYITGEAMNVSGGQVMD